MKKIDKKGQENIAMIGVGGIIFFLGVLIITSMGFDSVPAGHVGVTDTFGQVGERPWGPGVGDSGMKWTGIFTSSIEFSTRVQLKEYEASAASSDLQTVQTKVALNFKVEPIKTPELYKTIGTNYQDIIIAPIVQEAVKSQTAQYTAENLVAKRAEVKDKITDHITDKLVTKGLIVTEVAITDFKFSGEFDSAIEAKQVAEQDAKTAKNRYDEMEWTSKSMKLQTEVLEIKRLDLQKEWIAKWDGHLPNIITGDSQGLMLMVDTQVEE